MPTVARYAPLPNPHSDADAQHEMEAAFLNSDDELSAGEEDEDDDRDHSQRDRNHNGYHSLPHADPLADLDSPSRSTAHTHARTPTRSGTYDFENVADWTLQPPPGSPPPESANTSQGNSNGLVPDFSEAAQQFARRARRADYRRPGRWLRSVVPGGVADRLGLPVPSAEESVRAVVGGGTMNDGVFANVTAKPSRGVRIQEGDNVYFVPEEAQKDAPPSYASAQADAVPPYWETTIHAPSASTAPGDMVVDSLPTGSLFSFLWNMLVSISFQFVGFLLTYLLHSTHAAKLGSRAGLGVTLIQYGFAMRSRAEEWARDGSGGSGEEGEGWAWQTPSAPVPTFGTAAEAEAYYGKMNASSLPSSTPSMPLAFAVDASTPPAFFSDATTEWLSFFLMTVGWFILLTSLLSFWRVKRWERSILASAPSSSLPPPTSSLPSNSSASSSTLFGRFNMFRSGLGFPVSDYPGAASSDSTFASRFPNPIGNSNSADTNSASRHSLATLFHNDIFTIDGVEESGEADETSLPPRGSYVIPVDESNPERTHRLARAYVDEVRLQRDLRAAGLL